MCILSALLEKPVSRLSGRTREALGSIPDIVTDIIYHICGYTRDIRMSLPDYPDTEVPVL